METVQSKFKQNIKDRIAPGLRKLGFKGSGQNYQLPSTSHWKCLSFQKSSFSDAENLTFTINLLVIDRNQWEIARKKHSSFPKKPTATTFWGIGWQKRLGHLMPENRDYWWEISLKTDLDQLSANVLKIIEQYALPNLKNK